jgi:hypothetical protein
VIIERLAAIPEYGIRLRDKEISLNLTMPDMSMEGESQAPGRRAGPYSERKE